MTGSSKKPKKPKSVEPKKAKATKIAESPKLIEPKPLKSIRERVVEQLGPSGSFVDPLVRNPPIEFKEFLGNDSGGNSYKSDQHGDNAKLLKYIVHRINNVDRYDHDNGPDLEFTSTLQNTGNFADIDWYKEHLRKNPELIDQAIDLRDKMQRSIKRGIGLNVKNINGEDYVALTRGLDSPIMMKSFEHPLTSWADVPDTSFGSVQHHAWVPLKDIWTHFQQLDRKFSEPHGHENEFLVSNSRPRYQASPEDIKHSRIVDHVNIDARDHPYLYDNLDDDAVANMFQSNTLPLPLSKIITNLSDRLGPKSSKVLMGPSFVKDVADAARSKNIPREVIVHHLETQNGLQQFGSRLIQNPNLTEQDLKNYLEKIKLDENLPYHVFGHPHLTQELADHLFDKLSDSNITASPLLSNVSSKKIDQVISKNLNKNLSSVEIGWLVKNPNISSDQIDRLTADARIANGSAIFSLLESAPLTAQNIYNIKEMTDQDYFRVLNNPQAHLDAKKMAAQKIGGWVLADAFKQKQPDSVLRILVENAVKSPDTASRLARQAAASSRYPLPPDVVKMLVAGGEFLDELAQNRNISTQDLVDAWPSNLKYPTSEPPKGNRQLANLWNVIETRRRFDKEFEKHHALLPLPSQHVHKSEQFERQLREWLSQNRRNPKGFYHATTEENAHRIVADKKLPAKEKDWGVVWATQAFPDEHPERTRKLAESVASLRPGRNHAVVYFETPEPHQGSLGADVYWNRDLEIHNPRIVYTTRQELEKSFKGLLGAAAISLPGLVGAQPPTPTPHDQLQHISFLESSGGKNVAHAAHSKGDFHTAFGGVGLKPVTAHFEYINSPEIQKQHPGLHEPEKFTEEFKKNPQLYQATAQAHWSRLSRMFDTPERTAYAWRWGMGNAKKASDDKVASDPYVKKFLELMSVKVKKSESLDKMALRDLEAPSKFKKVGAAKIYDYSHLLPQEFRDRFELHVHDTPPISNGRHFIESRLLDRKRNIRVGEVSSSMFEPETYEIRFSEIRPSLRGLGLGRKMYEAVLAHAYHHHGIRKVNGAQHSSMAGKVHQSLAREHGFKGYRQRHSDGVSDHVGAFDGAYKGYSYTLKSEESLDKMAIRDIKPGQFIETAINNPEVKHFDFSHVLTPNAQRHYRLQLTSQHHNGFHYLNARIFFKKNNREIGSVSGMISPANKLAISESYVENQHRGQKLGESAYEAMMAHALHHHGVGRVVGDVHSTLASKKHSNISQRHGLDYQAKPYDENDESEIGDYDSRFAPYSYTIKSENQELVDELHNASVQLSEDNEANRAISAAMMLAGQDYYDHDRYVAALSLHDGDREVAALYSVGLHPNTKNLDGLRALIGLQSLDKKESETPNIHHVKPLTIGASDVTQELQRGIDAHQMVWLDLKGKHSRGAMGIKDPKTHNVWLIKPGSGRFSPAAGVSQESAPQSAREAAFWHVALSWGLDRYIPRAELVSIDGKVMAAIRLLEGTFESLDAAERRDHGFAARILEPYRKSGVLHKWAVLDGVLGQTDRHGQNLMVDDNGKVCLIDHGSTMAGSKFDPAHDSKSFIPYYLRIFSGKKFTALPPDQRLERMPTIDEVTDKKLGEWIESIDPNQLIGILQQYGIDPAPAYHRLERIKSMSGPWCDRLNRLWSGIERWEDPTSHTSR